MLWQFSVYNHNCLLCVPLWLEQFILRLTTKNWFRAKKVAFLDPKRATLGNRGHETARRAAKRPPTEKQNLYRVTSGYGEDMIPLSWIRLTPKNGGYMGVALKNADFRLKYAKIACSSKLLKVSAVGRQLINSVLVPDWIKKWLKVSGMPPRVAPNENMQ